MQIEYLFMIVFYGLINIAAFIVYGVDKYKAMHNKWRVPEKTLLFLAAIGGSYGAFLGMKLWRHKTKHKRFTISVPVYMILNTIFIVFIVVYLQKA